jgi:hypothetical protein
VRATRDGMTELVTDLPAPVASACREVADTYARMLKPDGDPRPIGQLRALVLADLILRPWDASRAAVTAHLTVLTPLGALRSRPEGPDGAPMTADAITTASSGTGWVDGQPITAAQLRELLAELDALCPGGLRAPAGAGRRQPRHLPDRSAHRRSAPPSPARSWSGMPDVAARSTRAPRQPATARRWTGPRRSTATNRHPRSGGSSTPATAPAAIPAAVARRAAPTSTTSSP